MTQRVIDVSALPTHVFGHRTSLWWAVVLMLTIEGTALALAAVAFVYLRQNFAAWPPEGTPDPSLGIPTVQVVLMLLACMPMYWIDMAARRMDKPKVLAGLGLMFVVSLAALALRAYEFPATRFWWNDNAYASVVWTTLGLAVTYQLAAAG